VEEELRKALPGCKVECETVPDEAEAIRAALEKSEGSDWVLTTGGTGPSPRDRTPETCRDFCDRELPGIAEYLRARSLEESPNAVFSRLFAGMRGRTYVVNFPGSERAARFCSALLAPLMEHGAAMARGEGHGPQ
jgi:molybdopterin adenylyltransferase